MSEPTTTAGVTLERIVRNAMPAADGVRDFILRIEAEARAAALDEARGAVLRVLSGGSQTWTGFPLADAVLAAIDALREDADKA